MKHAKKNDSSTGVPACRRLIQQALREDLGSGDVTSEAMIPVGKRVKAVILARGNHIVAGGPVARQSFWELDGRLRWQTKIMDGQPVRRNEVIACLEGNARAILAAERVALNFMQRLSGIATLTAEFVKRAAPYNVMILDTRKTTPLLRSLEKYAVRCGGGVNHRYGLFDRALLKDNHRRLWSARQNRNLADAIRILRRHSPRLAVEVEVESEAELRDALTAAPDWILLDNMSLAAMRRCVKITAGRCRLEASGGITLANVEQVARTGVDAISLGCLTHSAPAADLSLELE